MKSIMNGYNSMLRNEVEQHIVSLTNNFSKIDEPMTITEAMGMNDVDSWIEAMNEEIETLKKDATWDLVPA